MAEGPLKTEVELDPVELVPLETRPQGGGMRVQHIMVLVVLAAFLTWIWIVGTVWLWVLAIFGVVAMAVGAAVYFVRRNLAQQETLLWALSISAERSLPLAPAALAFADQFGSTFRWRLQLLAALLNQGLSLTEALDQVPNLLRRESLVLIETGAATGTLPRALREAAGLRSEGRSARGGVVGRFAYLMVILLVMESSLIYFVLQTGPRFRAISRDFGIEVPQAFTNLMTFGKFLTEDHPILSGLILLLEVAVMMILPLGVMNIFQWNIPFLDALFRRRHASLVLRGLALSIGGQRPILEGLDVMAGCYPSRWVRGRLKRIGDDVRRGEDWVDSMEFYSLIRPADAAVLSAAGRVGNLEWALRETASSWERRTGYRLQFWLRLLFPVFMIVLGGLAFAICLAYFTPLIKIIEAINP